MFCNVQSETSVIIIIIIIIIIFRNFSTKTLLLIALDNVCM